MKLTLNDLISLKNINGGTVWDRQDGSIYNPIGFSTMDFLSVIGDMKVAYKDEQLIINAMTKVISYYEKKSRLFKFAEKSTKLPCITAKILATISKINYDFPEMESCYQYFLETQQKDGGWRCATVKIGKSPETDASNPGTTLYVLDAFKFRNNSSKDIIQLNKGIEFLLNHWITKKPLGPCEFGIGSSFMKTEYPFIRYNIFYYSYVVSFYTNALKDKRFLEIIKALKINETNTGIKIINPHKSWRNILFKDSYECELANRKYLEIMQKIKES